jgi:hypothetical protein
MSSATAAPRAAVPVSNARAEASRRNGAKSCGPRTPEGKARAAQNALKHGMRAQKHVLLPNEDGAEFAALEAALLAELAPVGALQTVLARRVAVAAWRLERADRLEAEVLEFRSYEGANAGLALIRDGNGTRSFETLLRYRGAAMAEFWRALKTLKALQAEQARDAEQAREARRAVAHHTEAAAPAPIAARPARPQPARPNEPERRAAAAPEVLEFLVHDRPNEPERRSVSGPKGLEFLLPDRPTPAALHEPVAPWSPNEPERDTDRPLRIAPRGPDRRA